MPTRDLFHDAVRHALANDGWTVTDDPLHLKWKRKDLYVDLGAERFLGAEKEGQRIAVEIKSFVGASDMHDLEGALGQFILYGDLLGELQPGRILHLAVRNKTYLDVFEGPVGGLLLEKGRVRLLVFDEHAETILRWVP